MELKIKARLNLDEKKHKKRDKRGGRLQEEQHPSGSNNNTEIRTCL